MKYDLLLTCEKGNTWALEPVNMGQKCHYAKKRECILNCKGFPTTQERKELLEKARRENIEI